MNFGRKVGSNPWIFVKKKRTVEVNLAVVAVKRREKLGCSRVPIFFDFEINFEALERLLSFNQNVV